MSRCIRRSIRDSDTESDDDTSKIVSAAKYYLQSRKRKHGLDIFEVDTKEKVDKTRGKTDANVKKEIRHYDDDAPEIGTTFTSQSNIRDEEADMNEFVTKRLAEIQGKRVRKSIEKPPEDPLMKIVRKYAPPKKIQLNSNNQALIRITDDELAKQTEIEQAYYRSRLEENLDIRDEEYIPNLKYMSSHTNIVDREAQEFLRKMHFQ